MKKLLRKFVDFLPYLILLISFILIIQVATSIKSGKVPTLFGRAIFFVVSPSMEDTIMSGDMIFVNTSEDEFAVGDIITFRQPGDESIIITHRIIQVDEIDGVLFFTTQGDNNSFSLDWEKEFTQDKIIGKYVGKSGFLGGIYQMVFSNGVNLIFLVIILVFVVIGGMEMFNIINTLKQEKERKLLEEKERMIQEEMERIREAKKKLEEGK